MGKLVPAMDQRVLKERVEMWTQTLAAMLILLASAQARPDAFSTQVVLKSGEEIEVDGGRLRIGFTEVISDSRCPRGYRCISAGEAKIRLWSAEKGESRRWHTIAGPTRSTQSLSPRHSVQFAALDPYPEPGARKPVVRTVTLIVRTPDHQ